MERFEVVVVDHNHHVKWASYPWYSSLLVCDLKAQGILSGTVSVFSEKVSDDYIVKAGDRLECTQPLAMDPKAARRSRLKESN